MTFPHVDEPGEPEWMAAATRRMKRYQGDGETDYSLWTGCLDCGEKPCIAIVCDYCKDERKGRDGDNWYRQMLKEWHEKTGFVYVPKSELRAKSKGRQVAIKKKDENRLF